MEVVIKRLSAELETDFYRVHSEGCCGGWCFCAAWYVPTWEGFGERTAEENRSLRSELFSKGAYDGYLVYIEGVPAGWVQAGPRDRLPKLLGQFSLSPDPQVWAITCMALAPQHQGMGLAHEILRLILQDLRDQKVKCVQAFPKASEGLSKEEIWTGPLATYLRAGFVVVKQDERRPVLELML
jgi:GNAT superfamily N-acetyltransferase